MLALVMAWMAPMSQGPDGRSTGRLLVGSTARGLDMGLERNVWCRLDRIRWGLRSSLTCCLCVVRRCQAKRRCKKFQEVSKWKSFYFRYFRLIRTEVRKSENPVSHKLLIYRDTKPQSSELEFWMQERAAAQIFQTCGTDRKVRKTRHAGKENDAVEEEAQEVCLSRSRDSSR